MMDAAYFISLFEYDKHCNLMMLDLMLSSGNATGKAADLMAHMLTAQQTWLMRCKHLPAPGGPLWPIGDAGLLKDEVEQRHADWVAYLHNMPGSAINLPITYTNTRGETYTDTMRDIVTHVINHGTHHRAQIGMMLKQAGVNQLPPTDLIFFTRSQH